MRFRSCALLTVLVALGCGGSAGRVPVSGTVTLDGKPLSNAHVGFFFQGNPKVNYGYGNTDTAGKYQALSPPNDQGLTPGNYKVTISRRLLPDGSLPKPDVPLAESGAEESLPPQYSDLSQTVLTAEVAAAGSQINFELKSNKKP